MTEQAENFDPVGKNEPTRHISMELIADGARVTGLTLNGSRLVVTIEAELSASQVKTSGDSFGLTVPVAASGAVRPPVAAEPGPATPELKPGSSDQVPLLSGGPASPRNHPKSEQPPEDFPPASAKSDYDSGRLAIRKKNAGPITFGPDDSEPGLKPADLDADRVGLVQGLMSEATEPEIEPSVQQPFQPAPAAFETPAPQPATRWDDSEPVEAVDGRETRISARKSAPSPEPGLETAPAPMEPQRGEGKPLSFEFAMEAADKDKGEDKPKPEASAKHEAKTISFGPIDPAGHGDALRSDRDDKSNLFETAEPASPPPQPIPLARAGGAPAAQDAKPAAAPIRFDEPIASADNSAASLLETVPAGKMVSPAAAPGTPPAEDNTRWPGEEAPDENPQPAPKREKSPLLETVAPGQMIAPTADPDMETRDDSGEPSTPAPAFEAPRPKAESRRESARHSPPAAPIALTPAPAPAGDAPAQSEDSNVLGGERHGEPKPAISFGFEESEPERPETKPAAAPKEGESGKGTAKPEAGSTTVLIRYTCPRCKTQGMQAVDKVGTVVNCSNCGKAMRLVMKK